MILALIMFMACAHPKPPKSCLFPEFVANRCPVNHVCSYVEAERFPGLLSGKYECVPIFPKKAPEAR